MIAYADTSFLFSLYVPDANSSAAAAIMKRIKPPLLATDLAEFEFINALNGRIFRKEMRASEEQAVLLSFSRDVQAAVIRIVPLSAAALAHARRIARTHTRLLGTRALDVLHVASAVALRATAFFTFDQNQARLASALRLRPPPPPSVATAALARHLALSSGDFASPFRANILERRRRVTI